MSNLSTAEEIRKFHLGHEASIKAIGFLYLLGSVFSILGTLGVVVAPDKDGPAVKLVLGAVTLILGVLYFLVGRWLRRLEAKARGPATLLSAIGLLAVPIGTIINAYVLYLLHSEKGKVVFSDAYKEIMAATPGMKYRTPLWLWIFLIVIVLGVVGIIAAAATAAS